MTPEPLTNKEDIELRKQSVEYTINYFENRNMPDQSKMAELFTKLYKEIYNFISNKPYA